MVNKAELLDYFMGQLRSSSAAPQTEDEPASPRGSSGGTNGPGPSGGIPSASPLGMLASASNAGRAGVSDVLKTLRGLERAGVITHDDLLEAQVRSKSSNAPFPRIKATGKGVRSNSFWLHLFF